MVGWLVDCLVGWLVDWLVRRFVCFFSILSQNKHTTLLIFIPAATFLEKKAECCFFKALEPDTLIYRWSSLRNSATYSPTLHHKREIKKYVREFVLHFYEEVLVDSEEMTEVFSSGLVFRDIRQCHLRYAKNSPENVLKFNNYAGRAKTSKPFDKQVQKVFSEHVLDPTTFKSRAAIPNSCVPQCIAISMLVNLNGFHSTTLTMTHLDQMLDVINFKGALGVNGIPLHNFQKIEKLNHAPWSNAMLQRCPRISSYQGISLNLFRAKIYKPPGEAVEVYLFPKYLSRHHHNPHYYPVDMIIDSKDFWPEMSQTPIKKHVLCVTSLISLCRRRGNPILWRRNRNFICRACLKTFDLFTDQQTHANSCQGFPAGRAFQPRRALNSKIYKTFQYDKTTGQMQPNSIEFKMGDLYKTIRSLTTTVIDFESISNEATPDPRLKELQPKIAQIEQTPLSYSLLHTSNYDQFRLPKTLSQCRIMHLDHEEADEASFYLNLLTTLRDDLELMHHFTVQSLEVNSRTPRLDQLPPEERQKHLDADRCELCGYAFGYTPPYSARPLKQVLDHNHLPLTRTENDFIPLATGKGQTTPLCQLCNLHKVSNLHKKIPLIIHTQAGSSYDMLYLAKALVCFNNTPFPVRSHDGSIKRTRPLLKKAPRLLLRDAQTVLSIDFQFSCLDASCVPCQQKAQEIANKRKGKRTSARKGFYTKNSCIYARSLKIHDINLIFQTSLDAGISDLTETAKTRNIPIKDILKNTYSFGRELGLNDSDAIKFATQKLQMPFSLFKSAKQMAAITQPPPREAFINILSNTNQCLDIEQYTQFLWAWNALKCQNLLHIENIYCVADSKQLSDLIAYHLTKLHITTGLWGSYFLTISQLAMNAALLRCRHPTKPNERLKLEVVPEHVAMEYDKVGDCLL